MDAPRSALRAFLLATPLAVVVWMGCLFAWIHLTRGAAVAALMTPYILMGGVLFGMPLVVALVVTVAAPSFLLLRWLAAVSLWTALGGGAATGVAARLLVERMWGQPETAFLPYPVAVGAGLLAAGAWWRLYQGGGTAAWERGRGTM